MSVVADEFASYEGSLLSSWRLLASVDPDARIVDDGPAVTMTHSHPALCNAILRDVTGLDRIRGEFASRHHAIWIRTPDTERSQALASAGYVRDVRTVPMLLDLEHWVPHEVEPTVVAVSPGDLAVHSGMDSSLLDAVPDTFAHATPGWESWALTMTTGEAVNVSFVITRVEHQRRGLAQAVMTRALIDARERGSRHAALQSTEEGLRLYRRLGFRAVGEWQEWVPAP
jgi:ribosomal protein S18 acetylase RimI-like enzyme